MKKKQYINLDKKWKEILYAFSGFGPNLMMVLMGAFFTDAVNPSALPSGSLQAISTVCLITPGLFSILWFLGKVFDGIIDIPFASITDNLKTRFGKYRVPILICFFPMVISYILCWIPLSQTNTTLNTIWIFINSIIFFATYTMSLITFYGSLSRVCINEKQRSRVSSYKAFFDTISYCMVYALVPLMLGILNVHIDMLTFMICPIMLTILIPVFMIKEGDKFEQKAKEQGYHIEEVKAEEKVSIFQSIKLTFTNKMFMKWCLINCCSFFGLQMFLVAMNAMIVGSMGLSNVQMALLNTCAFGPVPLMLYLFNKLKNKKGLRFTYQTCLIAFAVGILSFLFGSSFVLGDNTTLKILIGCTGAIIGSWAIGPFFMLSYLIPSQISSVETKLTKKNHSAMYFAAQAVTSTIAGAMSSSLIYENIKMLFINKNNFQIVYASNISEASRILNVSANNVFNFGTLLVPILVAIFCILGFILAFLMPKNYTPKAVAKELNLQKEYEKNKDLFVEEEIALDKQSSLIENVALWILTGSIFGIFWRFDLIKKVNEFAKKKISIIHFVISVFIFPYALITTYKLSNEINKKYEELNIKGCNLKVLCTILSALGLEIVALSIMQHKLNKIVSKDYE